MVKLNPEMKALPNCKKKLKILEMLFKIKI
jgi:hypothetical protein